MWHLKPPIRRWLPLKSASSRCVTLLIASPHRSKDIFRHGHYIPRISKRQSVVASVSLLVHLSVVDAKLRIKWVRLGRLLCYLGCTWTLVNFAFHHYFIWFHSLELRIYNQCFLRLNWLSKGFIVLLIIADFINILLKKFLLFLLFEAFLILLKCSVLPITSE